MGRKDGCKLKRRKKNIDGWKTKTKNTPGGRLWRLSTAGCCCCCCSTAVNGLQVMECGDLGCVCVCVYLQCTLWTTMRGCMFLVCGGGRGWWCVPVSGYTSALFWLMWWSVMESNLFQLVVSGILQTQAQNTKLSETETQILGFLRCY